MALNLTTTIDDVTLRASFDCPEDAQEHVRRLESELSGSSGMEAARIHAELGNYYRTLGQLHLAEQNLRQALVLVSANEASSKKAIIYGVRLAHVLHWQQRWDEAEASFGGLLEACSLGHEFLDVKDFIFQHRGKMRFDRGDLQGALSDFKEALAMRTAKGTKELIESTEQAIRATKRRIEGSTLGT